MASEARDELPWNAQPPTAAEQLFEAAALAGLVCGLALVALTWSRTPERIPTHFGLGGQPDGWGGKSTVLFLPAVSLGLYLLLTLVSRLPSSMNYPVAITRENAATQYAVARSLLASLKAELVWLFTWIEWGSLQVALGRAQGLGWVGMVVALTAVFGTVGYHLWWAYRAR
ncbi:MAG TPA: DUF1648 domain-containing protein [Armatimonadota bacterium]|jgi:hypothetical protein